jgi:hypothetical protein
MIVPKMLGHYELQLAQGITIFVMRKAGDSTYEDEIYKTPSAAAQQIERLMADPNVKAVILGKIIVPQKVWVEGKNDTD